MYVFVGYLYPFNNMSFHSISNVIFVMTLLRLTLINTVFKQIEIHEILWILLYVFD